jgi:hypothetical protein
MKKTIVRLFTVFCVLFLSACFSPWEGDSGKGSLTISIGSSARSLFYDIDKGDGNNFSHAVSLKTADGEIIIDQQPFSGSVTISVPSGTYTVTVKGYEGQTLRSYGMESGVEVISGENTPVSIEMYSAVELKRKNWPDTNSLNLFENSGRKLYVFLNEAITIDADDRTVELNEEVDIILITETVGSVGITWNTTGSIFEISNGATLRLGSGGTDGTIALTGSNNNNVPLINVGDGGELVMDCVIINGNNNSGGKGGGVSVTNGGTLRIVTGTIYGSYDNAVNLRNIADEGASLYNNKGTIQYGTFSGDQWDPDGNLDTTNNTIEVVNGVLTIHIHEQVNAQIPSITSYPADATVTHNVPHSLSVAASASDGGEISYRWYSNTSATNIGGTIIDGATTASYYPPTDIVGNYYYFVEVTNTISDNGDGGIKTASIRSNAATLTVNERINAQEPGITSHPVSATVALNASSYSLSVSASSPDGGTLSYRWHRNTEATNSGGIIIGGATFASYDPPTNTAGTYYYYVEVTNTISDNGDGGTKTASNRSNAATLTVNERVNAQEPGITSYPVSATVALNASYSLSVSATSPDGGTLSYQWHRNTEATNSGGTSLGAGARSANYFPPTNVAGTYYYFVEVTNTINDNGDGGTKTASVRSNAATLTVNERVNAKEPNITNHPASATVALNASYSLSVSASSPDGGTLSYQWHSNTEATNSGGTSLGAGARSANYFPPINAVGTYYYFVEVTNTISNNGDGGIKTATARSNPVILTITTSGTFSIDFDQINDNAPAITVPTIVSLSGNNGPKTITLTVEYPEQYDNITWYVANVIVNGASFTLDSMNIANVGEHFLTLEAWKDNKPYSKTVVFTVME